MSELVLVTGANGFIGGATCRALHGAGYGVRAAVRDSADGSDVPTVRVGSIDGATDWSAALENVTAVVHLAGRAHVLRETLDDPLPEFRRVNTDGTRRLAEAAAKAGVKRFVFVSSIGVNGDTTDEKGFTEASTPAPHKPYAVSKWEAEQALRDIEQGSGLDVVIVRPPLVYGPDVPGNFRSMLRWVERGIPLPLGMVDNRRTLMGVENLADFLAVCVRHPQAAGELFLIGDKEAISTRELIRQLAQGMGRSARLVPFPPALAKLGTSVLKRQSIYNQLFASLVVDSTKARERLGWQQPKSQADGLRETARWYGTRVG